MTQNPRGPKIRLPEILPDPKPDLILKKLNTIELQLCIVYLFHAYFFLILLLLLCILIKLT
jgi:hypothetical protein